MISYVPLTILPVTSFFFKWNSILIVKITDMEFEIIFCDDCGEEIHGLYEDNKDGSYTCMVCLMKRDDDYVIDNEMGCDW